MNRTQKSLLLLIGIALPAAAYGAFAPKDGACFASGTASYQIASGTATPDFRVRIDDTAAQPDLRMRTVDRPEIADFVLVDDFSGEPGAGCGSSARIRTVKLDSDTAAPDVTVNLASGEGPADYKLYVHSVRFSQRDVAALLAAMWNAEHRPQLASSTTR